MTGRLTARVAEPSGQAGAVEWARARREFAAMMRDAWRMKEECGEVFAETPDCDDCKACFACESLAKAAWAWAYACGRWEGQVAAATRLWGQSAAELIEEVTG